jgi:hypothetical protein
LASLGYIGQGIAPSAPTSHLIFRSFRSSTTCFFLPRSCLRPFGGRLALFGDLGLRF